MPPSQHGGARPGAGRKPGGPFGEQTQQIRVPLSQVETVVAFLDAYRQDTTVEHPQPMTVAPGLCLGSFLHRLPAGFPSPAADYEESLDLGAEMIIPGHEAATFVVRVATDGYSMIGAGIFPGDKLVVDRALTAVKGDVVVAIVNQDMTIKTLGEVDGKPALIAENPHFKPILLKDGDELVIWGVVTHCLRSFHRGRRR